MLVARHALLSLLESKSHSSSISMTECNTAYFRMQVVMLGSGTAEYESAMREAEVRHNSHFR